MTFFIFLPRFGSHNELLAQIQGRDFFYRLFLYYSLTSNLVSSTLWFPCTLRLATQNRKNLPPACLTMRLASTSSES